MHFIGIQFPFSMRVASKSFGIESGFHALTQRSWKLKPNEICSDGNGSTYEMHSGRLSLRRRTRLSRKLHRESNFFGKQELALGDWRRRGLHSNAICTTEKLTFVGLNY